MKIYTNGLGQVTKMAALSIYGKNPLKNLLFQSQWTDYNRTWYVELGMQVHRNL